MTTTAQTPMTNAITAAAKRLGSMCVLLLSLILPNPTLTPGAVRTTNVQDVCPVAHTKAIRKALSPKDRRKLFAAYGIKPVKGRYEVDHLISLELGGSNDLANLWPQSYVGHNNAHDKDRLENQLHALVCAGELSLVEAQQAIATDWIAALTKYGGKVAPR